MPEISRFFGIIIRMFFNDHEPAHFHAAYGEFEALIEREVAPLLKGPVFDHIRTDPGEFARVKVEGGTVAWPNGADLCPDVLIWNGPPPELETADAAKAQR